MSGVPRRIERVTTVVIGAGHAGLAASHHLSARSIDHVVLERGEVANSWRTERWDSLRLLTPNWLSRLPGHRYDGPDPDGYMTMGEVVDFVERFAAVARAPVRTDTTVTSVRRDRRRIPREDQRRGDRVPDRRRRERRVQSADGADAQRGGAGVGPAADALRLPQSRTAARRRRARGRGVGDGRAAGRRAGPVGPAGDALGRRARPDAAYLSRARRAVVDGPGRACGTSGTTRSTT